MTDFRANADDFGKGVEFTGLFPGGVGKVFEKPFVSGTEEIGEFKIAIAEGDFFEVLDEVREGVVPFV